MRERIVVGQKIYLSPVKVGDAEEYVKWMCDSSIIKGLGKQDMQINLEEEKKYLQQLIDSKALSFSVIDLKSDELLGNYGIFSVDKKNKIADIGGFIGYSTERGKGYGTEAIELVTDYAFNVLNMDTVQSEVYDFNIASIKSFEKNGFNKCKEIPNHYCYKGEKYDGYIFSITREVFYKNHKTHFQDKEL